MATRSSAPDAANPLALAVILSSNTPLLLLDGDLAVLAASASFCSAFGVEPASVSGRHLQALGTGEWQVPQLAALLKATANGFTRVEAYEMDLKRAGGEVRHLVVNAQKLSYGDTGDIRLLLSVSDVTDARNSERHLNELLLEKAVLLKEVQHRVANSLQIISSVLLQSARQVQSDETRGHLHDAHNRVMSIAAVQKQLASSGLGDVALRPYFTQLCESLGASMIRDHTQLSIDVHADNSAVSADQSVSLGLIVTELVINSLKHAFPDDRKGKIVVEYHARGPNWTLSISDDGIGMPTNPDDAKAGLGTGIVEALARQMKADVQVADANPGTAVAIVHDQVAAVHMETIAAA